MKSNYILNNSKGLVPSIRLEYPGGRGTPLISLRVSDLHQVLYRRKV